MIVFGENESRRIHEAVKRIERMPRDETRGRRRPPIGGEGGCDSQNAILHITVIGKPTGGTFTIEMMIGTTIETLTFNWNDNAAAVKTGFAAHSLIATTDVDTSAGPFPNASMVVEFIGTLAKTDIKVPPANWTNLTGGSGVAVIPHLTQRGSAG